MNNKTYAVTVYASAGQLRSALRYVRKDAVLKIRASKDSRLSTVYDFMELLQV